MRLFIHDGLRRAKAVLTRLFPKQGVRGPTITLLFGSTSAAAISFLLQPVLTRLYGPEEFGVLSYFMALLSVLVTVGSFQYENALMQPDTEKEAMNILWLSVLLLGAATILLCLALPWRIEIAQFLGMPEVGPWLILIPPAFLGFRSIRLAELWLARSRRFRRLTSGQFANGVTAAGFRTVAALPPIGAGAGGLVGGIIAGQIAASSVYFPTLVRRHGRDFIRAFDFGCIRRLAFRYRRFSLFSTPASTVNSLLSRLPFLLIPLLLVGSNDAVLGHLGQAINVIAVPLGFIGSAVAQVLFVHASEAARSGELRQTAERVHARLVAIGLFPTLLLCIAGPDLLGFILGADWRESGVYVRFVGAWVFLSAVAAPLTRIFDVLERQRLDLLTSLGMLTALAAGLLVGGMTRNVTYMLLLTGLAGALARTVQIATLLRIASVTPREALTPYIRGTRTSLPLLLPIGIAAEFGPTWLTVLLSGAGLCAYGRHIIGREQDLLRQHLPENEETELPSGSPASQ